VFALGEEIALELHRWSFSGVEDLNRRFPEIVHRGSRLSLTRTEQESKLVSADALDRSKPPVEDQVRLMSGVAVSNYAPIHAAQLGSFETHAVIFAPVALLETASKLLSESSLYEPVKVGAGWNDLRVSCTTSKVRASDGEGNSLTAGDVAVVAAGMNTGLLLGQFQKALIPVNGQAFRSQTLRERSRSSVVGVTASWGFERYRFDDERRLLGCGVDPSGGGGGESATVDDKVMRVFLKRAAQLFTDFDCEDEESLMRWAVEFDGTCDGLPILGALTGEPRIQVACGFSISAWSRGWEAGRRLAWTVLGREDEKGSRLIKRCSPRRFATGLRSDL
jgi:glycine/D-amino acid oxidase-like deaminating enzyme